MGRSRLPDEPARGIDCLFQRRDLSVHLLFVDRLQDFADARTGFETEREQVTAGQVAEVSLQRR